MNQISQIQFRAMGCEIVVQLASDKDAQTLLQSIPDRIDAYENCLSRFRPESELMRLNAQSGQWFDASPMLFANIQAAKQAARISDGYFNPLILPAMLANGYDRSFEKIQTASTESTSCGASDWRGIELDTRGQRVRIPKDSALDLGGVAKAWIAQHLADELAAYGAVLVNIGGDIALRGMPDEEAWVVDVNDPFTKSSLLSVSLTNTHIVTSGIDFRQWKNQYGEKRHHIINPFTGQSAESDVLTATVIHPDAPSAEAFAKTLILLGAEKAFQWLHQQWQGAALIIKQDGTVLADSRFSEFIYERFTS